MSQFSSPLRDVLYSLLELHGFESHYAEVAPDAEVSAETVASVLEAVARFAERRLAPLNASGDLQGAAWCDGEVTAPEGFAQAYRQYVADGWPALAQAAEHGGQGLPYSLSMSAMEFLQGANQAWCMYVMLNDGAVRTLRAADAAVQAMFLPKLASGEWTATMCLTEAQAGSDLGLLRARAEPLADGRFSVTGGKIFISSGEHDLAANIVHLVLARLPDAPPGVRGISLFVVPKFLLDEEGNPGARNAVNCVSIEHKMGLKGSATCTMAFEGAQGWLVGEPHRGLAAMFIMINKSRLGVATQAVAQAQGAFSSALTYARERLQGRAVAAAVRGNAGQAADPLVAHPDVRRMLLTQKAIAEGGRALLHYCARWVDLADLTPARRAEAEQRLAVLTPVAKAFLSELGVEAADLGIQLLGGHGYVHESGLEQRLRDARITRIYEGTTGIQALDLLQRKVLVDPRPLHGLMREIEQWCGAHQAAARAEPVVAQLAQRLLTAVKAWRDTTDDVAAWAPGNPGGAEAVAVDYLMLSGYVLLGYLWARAAAVSAGRRKSDGFHAAKCWTAEFYFEGLLPRVNTHAALVSARGRVQSTIDPALL